ncbi:MAG TPA: hypothetical protein VGK99_24170 [Acidobacteriota bacterium]|jgi:hypothetical protein
MEFADVTKFKAVYEHEHVNVDDYVYVFARFVGDLLDCRGLITV